MPGEQHNPEWPWVHRTHPSHGLNYVSGEVVGSGLPLTAV